MPVNFYLNSCIFLTDLTNDLGRSSFFSMFAHTLGKGFFPHDITLTASVVGESVISHNSGGILIPLKWRDSLKASRWSKRRQKLVTRSYSHSNRLMARRYKYVYTPRMMGNSYAEYPPPQRLKYHRYYRRNPYAHREV